MRRLDHDDRGVAALEFGLVAPVLILLIMGTIELSIALFLGISLEQGVLEASRYSITGSTTGGVSREARVLQILQQYTFGLVTLSSSNLTTLVYPSFDDVGEPEPFTDSNGNGSYDAGEPFTDVNGNGQWDSDMGAAGLGGPGDIVVYRVNYDWGFVTRYLEDLIGDITLTGSIAVRNEPY